MEILFPPVATVYGRQKSPALHLGILEGILYLGMNWYRKVFPGLVSVSAEDVLSNSTRVRIYMMDRNLGSKFKRKEKKKSQVKSNKVANKYKVDAMLIHMGPAMPGVK